MKKTLVLRVTFVIIQLFCFTLYDNTIQAEFVGPLDVSEVIVRGAESFSPSWIIRQVGIKNYRSLTSETIVRQKAYEIEDLLKQRGFYFAACDYMIEELPENQEVKVTFRIDEGYRVIIEDVRFEGNFLIADRKLRDIVQTRPSGFFSKNFLNEEAISKDKNNIEKLYREEGIEAVVSRVEKAFNEEKNTVTVTFFIHEKSLTGSFHDQNARNVLEQFSLMQKELGELREDLKSTRENNERLKGELSEKSRQFEFLSQSRIEEVSQLESRVKDIIEENERLKEKASILSKKISEKEEVEDMLTGYLAQERLQTKEKQEEIKKMQEDIEKIQLEKEYLKNQLAKTCEEIEKERKEKDQLKDKMSNFTDMIKNRIEEIDKVNTQLAVVLDETRHAIARELDSIELSTVVITGDEAPKIIMKKEGDKKIFIQKVKTKDEEKSLSGGRVLIVNKKLNFIVINYGKDHGVVDNMQFGVFREDELVANIRIIETRDQISAAEIVYLKEGSEIQEGDTVSLIEG